MRERASVCASHDQLVDLAQYRNHVQDPRSNAVSVDRSVFVVTGLIDLRMDDTVLCNARA